MLLTVRHLRENDGRNWLVKAVRKVVEIYLMLVLSLVQCIQIPGLKLGSRMYVELKSVNCLR